MRTPQHELHKFDHGIWKPSLACNSPRLCAVQRACRHPQKFDRCQGKLPNSMAQEASEVGFAMGSPARETSNEGDQGPVGRRKPAVGLQEKRMGKGECRWRPQECGRVTFGGSTKNLHFGVGLFDVRTVLSLATLDEFFAQHVFEHPLNLRHEGLRVEQRNSAAAVAHLQCDFVPA